MIATKPNKKTFTCTSCKQSYPASRGKCNCGLWNSIEEVEVPAKVYRIPKVSKKRQVEIAKNGNIDLELQNWFISRREYELSKPTQICENCGTSVRNWLLSDEEWKWKSCISHLVAKKTFKSIATNHENYVLMCISCHQTYDTSWAKAIKMPVFQRVKQKFDTIKHLITESTTHLPEELLN